MSSTAYHCADVGLVRAAQHQDLPVGWPMLDEDRAVDSRGSQDWLRTVWSLGKVAEAVECASPVLAHRVTQLCAAAHPERAAVDRAVRAVVRYLLRATGRATPFGLFAGVGPVQFGPADISATWGEDHAAVARAASPWLAEIITALESHPDLRARLTVMVNNLAFVRGQRLVVPHPSRAPSGEGTQPGAVEVALSCTPMVRLVLQEAAAPVRWADLAGKLAAEFPTATAARIQDLLAQLLTHRVLLSSLHAPSAVPDALTHLLQELHGAGVDEVEDLSGLVSGMREIAETLAAHKTAGGQDRRQLRCAARQRADALGTVVEPVAVDLRLDCRVTLPRAVAGELERAATLLARLSASPAGTPAWQQFHNRFFERYGVDALVPLRDVVDPDVGIGFPAGFRGGDPELPSPARARDHRLLALAQAAALDRCREVVLDDVIIGELAGQAPRAVPAHLELCVEVRASDEEHLRRGRFQVVVLGVSRGAGTMTGRFVDLLDPADRSRLAAVLAQLPTTEDRAVPAQLTYAPLLLDELHVTRAPELMAATISLGEHTGPGPSRIDLDDLAVSCDSRRLRLVRLSQGCPVEPVLAHALDLRRHTPPLARFVAELGRAHAAVVTGFDWGVAAQLPYLPRLRYGRTIISPARWRLEGHDAERTPWPQTVEQLRSVRGLPRRVLMTEGDRRLPLDLDEPLHLALLRDHLARTGHAVLTETVQSEERGWLGGRCHEIVAVMTAPPPEASQPASRPGAAAARVRVPDRQPAVVIGRDHGHLPGSSGWCYAKLYASAARHDEILTAYLPGLLARWDHPPRWWFIRYRDPADHLRLRIAIPSPEAQSPEGFATAAQRIAVWAEGLRHHGLLRDLQLATSYPEVGRWGQGPVLAAAEDVFSADSSALLGQLAVRGSALRQAHRAAGLVDIACAFTGSTEAGMRWLIEHAHLPATTPLRRDALADVVRLADPRADLAALRSTPTGAAVELAWQPRRRALARYRALVAPSLLDPDTVLDGLLHAHHIRAAGIDRADEQACLRLARAAALTWTHRQEAR